MICGRQTLQKLLQKTPEKKLKSFQKTETSLQMVIIVVMGASLFLFTDLIWDTDGHQAMKTRWKTLLIYRAVTNHSPSCLAAVKVGQPFKYFINQMWFFINKNVKLHLLEHNSHLVFAPMWWSCKSQHAFAIPTTKRKHELSKCIHECHTASVIFFPFFLNFAILLNWQSSVM